MKFLVRSIFDEFRIKNSEVNEIHLKWSLLSVKITKSGDEEYTLKNKSITSTLLVIFQTSHSVLRGPISKLLLKYWP